QPEQDQREGRKRQPASFAEQDPEPDAEKARDQQEVAEEADVDHVGRYPADDQQLDEEQRRARQEEADCRSGEQRDRRDQLPSGQEMRLGPSAGSGAATSAA